jgi:hypothetical protein
MGGAATGIRAYLEWRGEPAESSARAGTFRARLLPEIRIPLNYMILFKGLVGNHILKELNVFNLPYCDLAASLAIPPHASPWYDDGSGGIPRTGPLHCGPDSDPRAELPGKPAEHLTAHNPNSAEGAARGRARGVVDEEYRHCGA